MLMYNCIDACTVRYHVMLQHLSSVLYAFVAAPFTCPVLVYYIICKSNCSMNSPPAVTTLKPAQVLLATAKGGCRQLIQS